MAEYIKRQTVLDTFKPQGDDWGEAWSAEEIKDTINSIPAADVRPVVRGRWEEVEVTWLSDVEDKPDAIASMFCSECRRYANHVYHYGNPRYGMNFCPWCGAQMGGDAEWESTSSTTPE